MSDEQDDDVRAVRKFLEERANQLIERLQETRTSTNEDLQNCKTFVLEQMRGASTDGTENTGCFRKVGGQDCLLSGFLGAPGKVDIFVLGRHEHYGGDELGFREVSAKNGKAFIIIDSMASTLNTVTSLQYNHDLFESLIIKNKAFNGNPRCTTENSLSKYIVTDFPLPNYTTYGPGAIVEHLKTSVPLLEQAKSHNHTTKQPAL
ncbi:hypothetical protein CLF_108671 [Clonorchis sinensis]|uniref:Uncharacterized protein n=1 Tax=Clonorchis sinensis TaxID=79923 RepID=G7YID6_CLOSI|nr:hypothetical protein CLF_108671 [Clonorchis sinensis]